MLLEENFRRLMCRFWCSHVQHFISDGNLNPQFIEGLLFISMLPLHHENPQRQKMMYLTGLTLLNEVL